MRTPNSECCICKKKFYRRPCELKKYRFFACIEHRAKAQILFGQTDKQKQALKLGRTIGINHLNGIPKSKESNIKRSKSMKKWIKNNPEKAKERGKKIRGNNHYNWKGGISNINQAIRRMTEYRKWSKNIKLRDKKCIKCNSIILLEANHIKPLSEIILEFNINCCEDARKCNILWDINNGITLCKICHYKYHNRNFI